MCAKPTGFLEYERQNPPKRNKNERLQDYQEVELRLPVEQLQQQAARCMDCGVPFCHATGCPLHNYIPDYNNMVYQGQWKKALEFLHQQINFPEFTGRICPALCEASCTLGLNQDPVTCRQIELEIIERGWENGWVIPQPATQQSGYKVAIIGSGPSGLAAAQQLARQGHKIVVFEKADRIGGLLRYGIPDYKLDKAIIDRRINQMKQENIVFETSVTVGEDISLAYLQRSFHAVVLACGARTARTLQVEGADTKGVHLALDFLTQQNKRNAGDTIPEADTITAHNKHIVIIGGGDTGSDCLGTSLRQGAISVTQLEIMPKPPPTRDQTTPWPQWPYMLRTSSSHEEGGERKWSILTKKITTKNGKIKSLQAVEVDWQKNPETGRMSFTEIDNTEFTLKADLILIAMGFTKEGNCQLLEKFGLVTENGNAKLDQNHMSSTQGIFVIGDFSKGASLVVRAINDGRIAAQGINKYLKTIPKTK